jgi:hypothetical protein
MAIAYNLTLFADYFQFYIGDDGATWDTSSERFWDQEAVDRLLAVAPGMLGIGTVRNMHVPVSLEIHGRKPDDDSSEWDHIVEASIEVASGQLVIAGCTDYFLDALRVDVAPGHYRARVSYGALESISPNHLSGLDHYRVQLWLGSPVNPVVVKQRPPSKA